MTQTHLSDSQIFSAEGEGHGLDQVLEKPKSQPPAPSEAAPGSQPDSQILPTHAQENYTSLLLFSALNDLLETLITILDDDFKHTIKQILNQNPTQNCKSSQKVIALHQKKCLDLLVLVDPDEYADLPLDTHIVVIAITTNLQALHELNKPDQGVSGINSIAPQNKQSTAQTPSLIPHNADSTPEIAPPQPADMLSPQDANAISGIIPKLPTETTSIAQLLSPEPSDLHNPQSFVGKIPEAHHTNTSAGGITFTIVDVIAKFAKKAFTPKRHPLPRYDSGPPLFSSKKR